MFQEYWKSLPIEKREDLARVTGAKVSYLRHVASGLHKPSAKLALKIHEATRGEVDKSELRPDYFL